MKPYRTFTRRLCAVILLAATISGCGLAQGKAAQGNTGAPTAQATPTLPLPTLDINSARTPTTAAPASPKTYADPQWGVTFAYPANWQETAKGRLQGADGYAWLETRPNDGAGPGAVCQGEANRGKPAQFGAYPEIVDMQVALPQPAASTPAASAPTSTPSADIPGEMTGSAGIPACLILPSADQPAARKGEALYLLWYPADARPNALLALHADRQHITEIVKSLKFDLPAVSASPAQCDYTISKADQPVRQDGLRIDMYPIAKGANCAANPQAEAFNQAVTSGPAGLRAQQLISRQWQGSSLAQVNAALGAFGFRLRPYDQYYAIYKNGVTVKTKLNWVGPLTENASKSDFILPVMDSYNSQIYFLRPDGIHDLGDWDILTSDRVFPVYVGDDLITPAYDYDRYPRPVNQPALLNIKKNAQVIDTLSVNQSTADGGPAHGLWSWDGHWVLELPGMVVEDGKSLNDQLGYSEMFTWRVIKNQPFYFFRKDGQIHLSYAGRELPLTFNTVIHKPDCCTSELLQMQLFENGLTFYAKQGDMWYYVVVEAGVQ